MICVRRVGRHDFFVKQKKVESKPKLSSFYYSNSNSKYLFGTMIKVASTGIKTHLL